MWDQERGFKSRRKTVACYAVWQGDLRWNDGTLIPQVPHHDYIGVALLLQGKMQQMEAVIVPACSCPYSD